MALVPSSSHGSGGFTGWIQDEADPANVTSEGGDLDLGANGNLVSNAATIKSLTLAHSGGVYKPRVIPIITDPTTSGGFVAPLGSLAMRDNGQAWLKTGSGNTDWTQIGGAPAGALQVVRVPLAFNTANLVLVGITAYTPAVGDVLLDTSYLSVTEEWDGATPGISLYSTGDGAGDEIVQHYSLTSTNDPQGSSTRNSIIQKTMGSMYLNASSGNHIIFDSTAALKLMVDDGSGGNPVSTQGAGEFVLIIAPAA